MGARMRMHNWTATPLGPPAAWPTSLRTLVGVMLGSRQPMFVAWGPERTLLYNDGYAPMLDRKHPGALGRPFFDVWPEIRDDVAPLFGRVFAGEPIHMDDIALVLDRRGRPEEAHFAFSYTPVRDERGEVAGLFCPCTETTVQVLAERRQAFRLAFEERLRDLAEPREVMAAAAGLLGQHLRAARVGYAEMEPDNIHAVVAGVWHGPHLAPMAGRYRLGDYGSAFEADCRAGRSVAVEDMETDPRSAGQQAACAHAALAVRAQVVAPLVKDGRLAAVMFVHAVTPRAWTGEDVALLREVAERTWSAVGRARAEAGLRDSRARFGAALAIADLGTFEWHVPTGAVVLDGRSREIFGFAPGEGESAQEVFDRIDRGDFDRVLAEAQASLHGLSRLETEYRIRLPDGTVRTVVSISEVVANADGNPEHLFGVFGDVTGRRRMEARRLALVEFGDRIRNLDDPADLAFAAAEILGRTLGLSRAGYGTVDPVAETIAIERDWSAPGSESLLGVRCFRDYGSYVEDLKRGKAVAITDVEKDPRTAATAEALKAIGARSIVNMPVAEQGGVVAVFYLNHATAREWPADELAFVREFTERTRTAVERARAEGELRALAASLERQVAERTAERDRLWELSEDLLVIADYDGHLLRVSPSWTRLLGRSEAELLGTPYAELLHPDDLGTVMAALGRMRDSGKPARFEDRVLAADGSWRWIAWTLSPEPGGKRLNGVGRDVTAEKAAAEARQRLEEQLRQSQKMEAVGQLTGGLAHDFNNLLAGISGSLELLQARVAQGRIGDLDRYLVAAQGASKRAAALTHRLLAFTRQQTLDPRPIDANRLIAGMEELIRRTVGPAVTVEVVAAGGLWTTLVDPNQLENALLNLCINARDAMAGGGRLTIETGNKWLDERAARERDLAPGQYVSLCVSDTGTGMTPEVAARAFDPFFTTKPIGMGTGLGLSMIYGFARQSGGQARIYSELGQGAMVCLYLPRHHGEAEVGDEPAARAVAPRAGQGETVLVVDDEPTVRMLVTEVLEELGYTAIEAADGPAGLQVLRSDVRLDLLVTDVGLPGGMNGRQVADAGRAVRPGLKVLFITGYAENAVVGNGHLDPGMHVLTKPFAMEALASRIKALIAGM